MRIALTLALAFVVPAAAFAARPHFDWDEDASNGGGLVRMDGKILFEIREPAGGWQPVERAEIVAGRLERLYPWIKPDKVRVGKMNNETVVEVIAPKSGSRGQMGHYLIVTVDEATARDLGKTKWLLAHWWRDLFRDYVRIAQGRKPTATYRFSRAVRQYWDASQQTDYDGRRALEAMPAPAAAELEHQYKAVPGAYAPAAPDIPQ
jgi:hypothetical protein